MRERESDESVGAAPWDSNENQRQTHHCTYCCICACSCSDCSAHIDIQFAIVINVERLESKCSEALFIPNQADGRVTEASIHIACRAGKTCPKCYAFASTTAACKQVCRWVYVHDLNTLVWIDIYKGGEHALSFVLVIRTKDYYKTGLYGSDLDDFVGQRFGLASRITQIRQKNSVKTELINTRITQL